MLRTDGRNTLHKIL